MYVFVPFVTSDDPYFPVVHAAVPDTVALLLFPDQSVTVVPLPSSSAYDTIVVAAACVVALAGLDCVLVFPAAS